MKNKLNKIFLIIIFFSPFAAFSQWEEMTNIPPHLNDTLFLDVFFLESNPDLGWVCGFEGTVLRTTDAGKTWDGIQIAGMDQLESIYFVNDSVGYTSGILRFGMGGAAIFRSTDGGISWDNITPDWTIFVRFYNEFSIWGNYFLDEENGMAVGLRRSSAGARHRFRRFANRDRSAAHLHDRSVADGRRSLHRTPTQQGPVA